jgi:sugar phosphate isomerase/epimerase
MFNINNPAALRKAMDITVKHGGTIFEMPYLLCTLPWGEVAEIANAAGIEEISLCHFFPRDENGAPHGDPLGNEEEVAKALDTIRNICKAADVLREHGIAVRFIDGPTWGCLGHPYENLNANERSERAVAFLKQAGEVCEKAEIILAVEFLRPGEGAIGGTTEMLDILRQVDMLSVQMHFDVFHSDEHGENVPRMIQQAAEWIVYLHLHGSERRVPGSEGDTLNWKDIAAAIKLIPFNEAVGPIPAVSEPFGERTRAECPPLGVGLPEVPEMDKYLPLAAKKFREVGILPMAA